MSSRQQFAAHKKIIEESQSPTDRYANGLENLRLMVSRFPDLLKHQSRLQGELQRSYLESEAAVRKLTTAENRRLKELNKLGIGQKESLDSMNRGSTAAMSMQRSLAGLGIAFGAVQFTEFIKDSIKTAASIERNAAAFEVFTGSAQGASKLMGEIRKLSAASGVSFNAMQASATTLLSFGIAVDRVIPSMVQMANITRGDPERFRAMSLAYAQIQAAGKLMGQELLQLVNAGFNPLVEISRTTGKSVALLRAEMERGEISAQMIAEAFESVTGSGGKYNGMLEKMSMTTSGSLLRMQSKWEVFKAELGDSLGDLARDFANFNTELLEATTDVVSDPSFREWIKLINLPNIAFQTSDNFFKTIQLDPNDIEQLQSDVKLLQSIPFGFDLMRSINPERARVLEDYAKGMKAIAEETQNAANKEALYNEELAKQLALEQKRMDSAVGDVQSRIASIEEEINKLTYGEGAALEMKIKSTMPDFPMQELERLKFLNQILENIKEETREKERQAQLQKEMERDAESLTQKFEAPFEKLARELDRLDALRLKDLIDDKTYMKAREAAINDAVPDRPKERFAETIVRGSQESARLQLGGSLDRQTAAAEKTAVLMKALVHQNKKVEKAIREQPRIKKV